MTEEQSHCAITVRLATSADDPILAALERRTWCPEVTPGLPRADGAMFSGLTGAAAVLVAVVDGEVCGYVVVTRPTDLPSNSHVLKISGLAVDPDYRCRGVGAALMSAAATEAARRGATRLTLHVLGHNTVARALYEHSGFAVEGVLVGEFVLGGVPVDDILMARRIDDGRALRAPAGAPGAPNA